ncbi:MAG: DUF2752 domain-containing protein [Myxococcota bacterium]
MEEAAAADAASLSGARGGLFSFADVYAAIALLAVLVARFVPFSLFEGRFPCAFRAVTGLPCLSCGFTRAFVRTAHLDLEGALRVSPLGTALFLFLMAFAAFALLRLLLRLPWPRLKLSRSVWKGLGILAAVLGAANWFYLLYRHLVMGDWA